MPVIDFNAKLELESDIKRLRRTLQGNVNPINKPAKKTVKQIALEFTEYRVLLTAYAYILTEERSKGEVTAQLLWSDAEKDIFPGEPSVREALPDKLF